MRRKFSRKVKDICHDAYVLLVDYLLEGKKKREANLYKQS